MAAGQAGETAKRKTILSRRRNSYRFFDTGWRAGWRAISCQSACPGKGGPFIRNRLKAQINKPCRRRFILHITSRRNSPLPVSSYTDSKPRAFDLRVCPTVSFGQIHTRYVHAVCINNEDATNRRALYKNIIHLTEICIKII